MQKTVIFNFTNFNLTLTLFFLLSFSLSSNAMGVFERTKLKLKSWRAGQGQHHNLKDTSEQENKEQELEDRVVGGGLQENITFSYHGHDLLRYDPYFKPHIKATYCAKIETKYQKDEKIVDFVYSIGAQRFVEYNRADKTWRSRNPFVCHKKTNLAFPDQETIESKVLVATRQYKQKIDKIHRKASLLERTQSAPF